MQPGVVLFLLFLFIFLLFYSLLFCLIKQQVASLPLPSHRIYWSIQVSRQPMNIFMLSMFRKIAAYLCSVFGDYHWINSAVNTLSYYLVLVDIISFLLYMVACTIFSHFNLLSEVYISYYNDLLYTSYDIDGSASTTYLSWS
jgi:hypothetical protein